PSSTISTAPLAPPAPIAPSAPHDRSSAETDEARDAGEERRLRARHARALEQIEAISHRARDADAEFLRARGGRLIARLRDQDRLRRGFRLDVDAVLRAVVDVVIEPQRRRGGAARPGDHEHARQIEALLDEPALGLPLHAPPAPR